MKYLTLNEDKEYGLAILIKGNAFIKDSIIKHYFNSFKDFNPIAFDLDYGNKKKPTAKCIHAYLKYLLPSLVHLKIKNIYCADAEYFKKLTGSSKAEPHLGYVLDCKYPGYEDLKVVYGVNWQSLMYDPKNQEKLDQSLTVMSAFLQNRYKPLGSSIIHTEVYPESLSAIQKQLQMLHQYPSLTCDLETYSLSFYKAGMATIAFAWNQHEGLSFTIDKERTNKESSHIRKMLKAFFATYKGNVIYHNAAYDVKVLCYELWMKDLQDYLGMNKGLNILCRNIDDTKVISYLAINSTAGNKLSLKELAHEYAGNYALTDIDSVGDIPTNDLCRYNLIDCLSTWYVYDKYYPRLEPDGQIAVYEILFKPAIKQIIQMEMVGMPLDMEEVNKVSKKLHRIYRKYSDFLHGMLIKIGFIEYRQITEAHIYNTTRKIKRKTKEDFKDIRLNIDSPKQLQDLLYSYWNFPVISLTDTKQPSVDGDTLNNLLSHTEDSNQRQILKVLMHLSKVGKILSAFIPKFEAAEPVLDGTHRLFGSFNLGGTVSGRLSCVHESTPVVTISGLKQIKDIQVGDLVYTHKGNWKPVTHTWIHPEDMMYKVTFCNRDILYATLSHRLHVPNVGWKTIEEIQADSQQRNLARICKIESIDSWKSAPVFDITVADDESYMACGVFHHNSSKPNLQQIPNNSFYGKMIKKCFKAPKGYVLAGADYSSLEDRVSALTTHDPNKISCYTDGYDGHCLRAYAYFKDEIQGIENTVESINSIKDIYPELRQKSKAPTFALTYQGTAHTLVKNCGFTLPEAKEIEKNYHELYKVSDDWVKKKLEKASQDGYVTVAFGLRIRTPLIHQVLWNNKQTPYEALAEGRTIGNAFGQSYGLVNTYAGIQFQRMVLESEYATSILPIAHIHDAQYFLVKDEVGAVQFLNNNLIDCMKNHGLPELDWHPDVKLEAELDLFYPSWNDPISLDNQLSITSIKESVNNQLSKRKQNGK